MKLSAKSDVSCATNLHLATPFAVNAITDKPSLVKNGSPSILSSDGNALYEIPSKLTL